MIRSALRAIAVLLAMLLVVGFGYERLARAGDAARYPPPGELVEVDGHRLHLLCSGAGGPTVVLEAGLSESALGWAPLQRELAATSRVCSYDRAGMAWSEPSAASPTAARSAEDLHALLANAGEPGPYVVVGHSLGAMVVRVFADAYPTEVAGLVLIDPTNEQTLADGGDPGPVTLTARLQGLLAEVGVVRLFGRSMITAVAGVPPPEVLDAVPILYGAQSQAAAVRELEASAESARRVRETVRPGAWGDLPVVVISAADSTAADQAHHAALAAMSTRGVHTVAESGGHYVHYFLPNLVTGAIRDLP
jgi:pimeloyl-ACP methyl ester carboxylesterase